MVWSRILLAALCASAGLACRKSDSSSAPQESGELRLQPPGLLRNAGGRRARAQEDIRLATERAMADLQSRVAELSIELAEKVVERNLDRDTQIALIENYINQVGSN